MLLWAWFPLVLKIMASWHVSGLSAYLVNVATIDAAFAYINAFEDQWAFRTIVSAISGSKLTIFQSIQQKNSVEGLDYVEVVLVTCRTIDWKLCKYTKNL